MADLSGEARSDAPAAPAPIERLTAFVAVLGGVLTLAVALLATTSVLLRWLFSAPIDGDFEYVKMATAVAVFAYLPYTQVRRANIMVDTFTSWLPIGAQRVIDAFWDLVFAALTGYLAWCLVNGTLGLRLSGETTMQRQLVLWPSVGLSAALAALVAVAALATARALLRTPSAGSGR